ncbi:MAG: CapA family protein [Peptococcaceae bacterium]|jgi:poly-gamma-glutamate synthesis protein (capsule biosynthesis protein)|nr:CapA family protein [Peptococcaceae bacterium]
MMSDRRSIYKARRKRQTLLFALFSFCLITLAVLLFKGDLLSAFQGRAGNATTIEPATTEVAVAPVPVPDKARKPRRIPDDWEFTILSTGDIMMHLPQTSAGWDPLSQSYDYAFMFEKVAPILRQGDIVIGNLETPLAGQDNGGFTGYPMFNAPEALALNLRDAGFTLVSTANNHSLDRRYQGLCTTLDNLDAVGLLHAGTYRTAEEKGEILYTEVKGVKIGVIAATYGTNGLTLPGEYGFAVDYIHEGRLLDEVRRAKLEGAHYVIVMLHWGLEYQPKPNQEQTNLAIKLLKEGADLVLGNHPHVLQRGEIVHLVELYALNQVQAPPSDEEDGEGSPDFLFDFKASGKDQSRFIMYSQGNFVSNQEGMERLCSILLKLTIGVDGATGEPYFKDAGYIPIYTQKRDRQGISHHTIWPLELALEDLEAGGQSFNAEDRASIPKAWDHVLNSQPAIDLLLLKDTPLWAELSPSDDPDLPL